jgi:hypothetical protein
MGKSSLIDSSIFAGIKSFSISFGIVKVLRTISSHLDKRTSNKLWFFNQTKFKTKVDRNNNFTYLVIWKSSEPQSSVSPELDLGQGGYNILA